MWNLVQRPSPQETECEQQSHTDLGKRLQKKKYFDDAGAGNLGASKAKKGLTVTYSRNKKRVVIGLPDNRNLNVIDLKELRLTEVELELGRSWNRHQGRS